MVEDEVIQDREEDVFYIMMGAVLASSCYITQEGCLVFGDNKYIF